MTYITNIMPQQVQQRERLSQLTATANKGGQIQRQKKNRSVLLSDFGIEFPPKETGSVLKNRASSPDAHLEPLSVQLDSVSRGKHITRGLARSTSQRKCLCFYSQQAANFFWRLLED